jgi:hypothetical protein
VWAQTKTNVKARDVNIYSGVESTPVSRLNVQHEVFNLDRGTVVTRVS